MEDYRIRFARYRLYRADDVLLYVGSSDRPDVRFGVLAHNAWWAQVARKDITWFDTEQEARDAEAASVVAEHPLHNVRLRSSDLTKTVAMRVTPEELAEIDAARGVVSRSEWLRRTLLDAKPRLSGQFSLANLRMPVAASGCQQDVAAERLAELRLQAVVASSWHEAQPRTEAVATRVSSAILEAIDHERGHLTRSEWLARLIEDHFEDGAPARGPARPAATGGWSPDVRPEPVPSAPAPARKSRRKAAVEPEPAPPGVVEQPVKAEIINGLRDRVRQVEERPRCPHPGTRSIGGFCRHCQANVESGGWLPAGWVAPEGWES